MKRFFILLLILAIFVVGSLAKTTSKSRGEAVLEYIDYVIGLWSVFIDSGDDGWWWDEYGNLLFNKYSDKLLIAIEGTEQLLDNIDQFIKIYEDERQSYLEGGDWVPEIFLYTVDDYLTGEINKIKNRISSLHKEASVIWNSTWGSLKEAVDAWMTLQFYVISGLDIGLDIDSEYTLDQLKNPTEDITSYIENLEKRWTEDILKPFTKEPAKDFVSNEKGMGFVLPRLEIGVWNDPYITDTSLSISSMEIFIWLGQIEDVITNEEEIINELYNLLNKYIPDYKPDQQFEITDLLSPYLCVGKYYVKLGYYVSPSGSEFEAEYNVLDVLYENNGILYELRISTTGLLSNDMMKMVADGVVLP